MKRATLYFVILTLLLALAGCRAPAAPLYDTAPAAANQKVYFNGTRAARVLQEGNTLFFDLQELAALLNGQFTQTPGTTLHTASLTVGNITLNYAAGAELPGDRLKAFYTGEAWFGPMENLPELLGYHPFTDAEAEATYYTLYPLAEELPKGVSVPTLMYHAVSDTCWGIESLFVSPKNMEQQLQYLTENGYTPIWFEDLGRADEFEKPVLLTFDDGYEDNYTDLFPLLKKYNVKATIFMITGSLGEPYYLNTQQLQEMAASGLVSFQSHTISHPYLSELTEEQLQTELLGSKRELAKLTGKEPFVLCYPTGKYSAASLAATRQHYQFGLLMSGKTYQTGQDPLKITRKYISRSTDLETFKNMIR